MLESLSLVWSSLVWVGCEKGQKCKDVEVSDLGRKKISLNNLFFFFSCDPDLVENFLFIVVAHCSQTALLVCLTRPSMGNLWNRSKPKTFLIYFQLGKNDAQIPSVYFKEGYYPDAVVFLTRFQGAAPNGLRYQDEENCWIVYLLFEGQEAKVTGEKTSLIKYVEFFY